MDIQRRALYRDRKGLCFSKITLDVSYRRTRRGGASKNATLHLTLSGSIPLKVNSETRLLSTRASGRHGAASPAAQADSGQSALTTAGSLHSGQEVDPESNNLSGRTFRGVIGRKAGS